MKSVLISIQPKWVEKIASGEKTIEVRKTRPKLETPFKCYINNSQISQISARIDLYAVGKNRTAPSQRIDLCEDCYQEFINFLERSN